MKMNHRNALLCLSILASWVWGNFSVQHVEAKTNDSTRSATVRPNIVFIMADDLGYECLSCNGSTSYKTPELDKLAMEGMRFTNCHSMPLCTPTRVQLMSGQYNFRNYTKFGALEPSVTTFAHVLKKAGYTTCVVGKWQLAARGRPKGSGTYPQSAGFDEHCLWQVDRRESRYWDPIIQENGKYHEDLKGRFGPDVFVEYANDYIERHKDKSFFLYYPMCLTHSPFIPTPDSADKSRKFKSDPKFMADMVAYMDKGVGRIVSKLDETGLREKTLVVFSGDKGTSTKITSQMGSITIRGGKGKTIHTGTHVPFIANWKGKMPSGKVCEDLVDLTDFMPTLAEVGRAEIPKDMTMDGRSFLPQLLGKRGNPRQWIFCYYNPHGNMKNFARYAYDKHWKLYQEGRLYDLKADPMEQKPIPAEKDTAESAAARKRLQAVLDKMKREAEK